MMSSSDEQEQKHVDAALRGTEHAGYETLGCFSLEDTRRTMDRLDEEHIPYEVDAPNEGRPPATPYLRRHWLFIYVRPEHKHKAEAIVLVPLVI